MSELYIISMVCVPVVCAFVPIFSIQYRWRAVLFDFTIESSLGR